jgi:hypothetical protein
MKSVCALGLAVSVLMYLCAATALPKCSQLSGPMMAQLFPFIGPPTGSPLEVRYNCDAWEPELCGSDGAHFMLTASFYSNWTREGGVTSVLLQNTSTPGVYAVNGQPLSQYANGNTISGLVTLSQVCDAGLLVSVWSVVRLHYSYTPPIIQTVARAPADLASNWASVRVSGEFFNFDERTAANVRCVWHENDRLIPVSAVAIDTTTTVIGGRPLATYAFDCEVPSTSATLLRLHLDYGSTGDMSRFASGNTVLVDLSSYSP